MASLTNYFRFFPSDLYRSETEFFNSYVTFLTRDDPKTDVKLAPVAVVDAKVNRVFFSARFQEFIRSQNIPEEDIKSFFIERQLTHIQEFKEISTAASEGFERSLMLCVISSAYMERNQPPHELPGELYHRDGKGNAISVKISLTENRVWEQGQLNIIRPREGEDGEKTVLGRKHSDLEPTAAPRLNTTGEAFLLNNKEVYHAVVTPYMPLTAEAPSGRRTIVQERLNLQETLDPAILASYQ